MMRGSEIKKGELVSLPDMEGRLENKDEVWNLAVDEVMARVGDPELPKSDPGDLGRQHEPELP